MYLSDYGTIHILLWLRSRQNEREERGTDYELTEGERRSDGLIGRVRRWLRYSQPARLAGVKPAHQNG